MELPQEYLDEKLKNLATKDDLKPLATKKDIDDAVDELAQMVANTIATPMEQRFAKLEARLDVAERVKSLETDMRKIKEALHIR
jgi:cell fate (sporulation/competence/biofilm development) regulator YmcA (YheA/YmcA/DUF963 family)